MPNFNFQELFEDLKESVVALAKISFKKLSGEAAQDGSRMLEQMKENLQRWTIMLANGDITPEEFEMLVLNEKDLVHMQALRQAGLAAIRAEQFRNGVVNMLIDRILNLV